MDSTGKKTNQEQNNKNFFFFKKEETEISKPSEMHGGTAQMTS